MPRISTPHLATLAAVASILVVAVSTAGSAIAPASPSGLSVTGTSASSISTNWAGPTGQQVLRYRLFVNGSAVGSTTTTSFTFTGLACGQSYTLGVAALDMKESVSAPVATTGTTDACASAGPPPTRTPPPTKGGGSPTPAPTPAGAPSPATTPAATTASSNAISTSGMFFSPFNGSFAPWSMPFCKNGQNPVDTSSVHFGTYSYDTQIVGQGADSIRLDLPAWSAGRTRCQLGTPRSVNVGSDDYYGLMLYLPSGWKPAGGFNGVQIAELNYQGIGDGTANVALDAQSDHVTLAMATGVVTSTFPYSQYRSNADSPGKPNLPPLYAIPAPMQMGVWHELIIHVHWATDSSGQVEIWHRVKGQSAWTQTVSFSGYPTLKSYAGSSIPTHTSDIIQAYRLASTAPVSVWFDSFTRSTSFNAAAANLP